MKETPKPNRNEFMDDEMRELWESMGPLPGQLRLYGGTALALYRNHRPSTDFDFATPQAVVDINFVGQFSWLKGAELNGGPGMVDAIIQGKTRDLIVTFMECGSLVPFPSKEPVIASNGVAVAHPIDLVASKMAACISREQKRDYDDMAEAIKAWPEWCRQAVHVLKNYRPAAISRALAAPPHAIHERLDTETVNGLRAFARGLAHTNNNLDLGL